MPANDNKKEQQGLKEVVVVLVLVVVAVVFTSNRSSHTSAVHPVCVLILHPRHKIMWSQTAVKREKNKKKEGVCGEFGWVGLLVVCFQYK